MQVISGKLKGRKIKVPKGIRPVSQRVKESCFDIIGGGFQGKDILDLYAGSGSLGVEALSRGAGSAVFVDKSKQNIRTINTNLCNLKLEKQSNLYCKDSHLAIKDFCLKNALFGFIFLDPPYYNQLLTKSLQLLKSYDIVARSGYIIGFCYENENYGRKYGKNSLVLDRKYGQSRLLVYKKE